MIPSSREARAAELRQIEASAKRGGTIAALLATSLWLLLYFIAPGRNHLP